MPDSLPREAAYALKYAEVEDDLRDYAESLYLRDYDRYPAGYCAYAGETAPLLFTALSNQFWSTDMMQPIANPLVTIFKFAMSPPFCRMATISPRAGVPTQPAVLLVILARVLFSASEENTLKTLWPDVAAPSGIILRKWRMRRWMSEKE